MKPDPNSGKSNQGEKPGSEFFVAGGNGPLFFDALEEVFDMVAFLVKSFVEGRRRFSIRLGRDAGLQAQPVEGPAELIAVIGFVGEDGSLGAALHQAGSGGQIVALSGGQAQPNGSSPVVDQGMDLGVGPAPGVSNFLKTSNFHGSETVFVNFDTGRIDGPQLPFRLFGKLFENLVPYPCIAPLFPAGVDGGVRGEDTQCAPGTTFSQPEEQGLKYEVHRRGWTASLSRVQYRFGLSRNLINFFSSSSFEVSLA